MCRGKSAQCSDQQIRYREPDQRLRVKNRASGLFGEPTYQACHHSIPLRRGGPQVQGSGLRTRSRIRKDIPQGKHGLKSRPELRIVNNRRLLMCRGKSAQYSDQQTRYREPDQRLCVKNKASSLFGEPTYHRVRPPPSLFPLVGAASESARIWPPYL